MKFAVNIFVPGFALALLAARTCYAQQTSATNDVPLGDIARELKAHKAKEPKPVRVITNDDLNRLGDDTSKFAGTPNGKKSADSAQDAPVAPAKAHDEAYYRAKLSALRGKLDTNRRELEVLQQKLSQNDIQYYPDPNKALQQQYTREDINKLTAEIAAKKDQISDDEKSIEDLHDQLRREEGDPSWLR